MSDSKSGDDKTLHVASKKTLTLKRGGNEQGVVRQNFSHGRTKAVVVETKKRKFTRPDEKPATETARPAAAAAKGGSERRAVGRVVTRAVGEAGPQPGRTADGVSRRARCVTWPVRRRPILALRAGCWRRW